MHAVILGAALLATAGLLLAQPAAAGPKKALGDYSQVCKDEHLRCLNQCQENYSAEADIRACFGVCDDWLDTACDVVFPKALVRVPGRLPKVGVLQDLQAQGQTSGARVPLGGATLSTQGQ